MKRSGWIVVVFVLFAGVAGYQVVKAQPEGIPEDFDKVEIRQIGRYQIAPSAPSGIWLVDTTTGQVWVRARNGDWQDKGTPVQAEPKE